jgi:hypothetical protein
MVIQPFRLSNHPFQPESQALWYGTAPDGAMTVGLSGSALIGLAALRRKLLA